MKIEKLEIKNITSIEYADIDFTKDPLKNEHLFSICGETGSGKSTLLDAIVMALYAQTPRFSKKGNSSPKVKKKEEKYEELDVNDIRNTLRQDCQEGFVKVDFIGNDNQRYYSKVVMNKKKNDKIKIECELKKDNGDIIEFEKNKEIIGLTYDQFVKTVILPQNEFSQFLKSDYNTKINILEKLTNTEIYNKIGNKIKDKFDTCKTEKTALQNSIDAVKMELLDNIDEVKQQKNNFEEQKIKQDKQIKEIEYKKNWLQKRNSLKNELSSLEQKLENLKNLELEINSIKEELENVQLINKDIIPDYEKLRNLESIIQLEERKKDDKEKEIEKNRNEVLEQLIKKQKEIDKLFKEFNSRVDKSNPFINNYEKIREVYIQYKTKKEEKEIYLETQKERFNEKNEEVLKVLNDIKEIEEVLSKESIPEDINGQVDKLKNHKKNAEELNNKIDELYRNVKKIRENNEELEKVNKTINNNKKELEEQESNKKKYILFRDDIKELRNSIVKNERCPVCGSKEHPYINNPELIQKELEKLSESSENNYDIVVEKIKEIEQEIKNNSNEKEELNGNKYVLKGQLEKILEDIKKKEQNIPFEFKIEDYDFINDTANNIETSINNIKDSIKNFIEEQTDEEKRLKKIIRWSEELKEKESNKENLQKELKSLNEKIQSETADYEEICNNYNKLETEIKDINQKLVGIWDNENIDAKEINNIIKEKRTELINNQAENKNKISEIQKIISKIEGELSAAVNSIEKNKSELNDINEKLINSINNYNKEHPSFSLDINTLNEIENKYDDVWIQENNNKIHKYNSEFNNVKGRYDQKRIDIENHNNDKNKPLENQTEESLNNELDKLNDSNKELTKKILELHDKIKVHELKNKEYTETLTKLEKIEKDFKYLSILDNYLGGNKKDVSIFKKLVQECMLDILIKNANKKLNDLSSRYEIQKNINKTNSANYITFNIIDKEMANQVRPIEGLSGGETFIVSLGLALGLTSIITRKLPIDIMFIDEGFGSLDGATLEDVLATLNELSRDRKIGIISHLDIIKERISTQICLEKQGNGRSKVIIKSK